MPYRDLPLVDPHGLETARQELGGAFVRILGYYRTDGASSITAIEDAMHQHDAAAMVRPAHSLKGESRQFGADRIAELCLLLEMTARRHVEDRAPLPDDLVPDVAALRHCFHETLLLLEPPSDPEPSPKRAKAPPPFGRRAIC